MRENQQLQRVLARLPRTLLVLCMMSMVVVRDTSRELQACCPVYALGRDIRIADQKILIVWDPQTRTEHFIREAAFQKPRLATGGDSEESKAGGDFGFLVPSPSQPRVEEADSSVFGWLEEKIRPRIEVKDRWKVDPFPFLLSPFALRAATKSVDSEAIPPMSAVSVLELKKVAGYEVAVLKASDARELTKWLQDNQYEVRPNLEEWSKPYVEKGWVITAFKYDTSANRTEVGGVRMSFETDRPLFPYRVPKDQFADEGRGNRLRVFVAGPGRAAGTLGDVGEQTAWNRGQLRYSMPLQSADFSQGLGRVLPSDSKLLSAEGENAVGKASDSKKGEMWLTAWDDRTWPSSDQDLWFDFDAKGKPHQEVQRVVRDRTIPLPIDVLGVLAITVGMLVRRKWVGGE